MRGWFWGVLLLLLLWAAGIAQAAEEATWVRYPVLSPDGQRIVFTYRGDLWTVPVVGGEAARLTSHEGVETRPVWSHDGTRIAFASDRHGDFDVFVVPSTGGRAVRLTWHSAADFPCDFDEADTRVLFTSARQDAVEALLPSHRIPELWSVPVEGGRPRRELTTPAAWARVSPDGKRLAYEDRKGYENTWRKHHVSPVARDVWIYDRETGHHRRLTDFGGEDRNPVWLPDGTSIAYLSERDGSFNVYREGPDGREQLTSHDTNPVRFLSAARDGTLGYGWNGTVWVRPPEGPSRRVPILVATDDRKNDIERETLEGEATDMAVSPDGEEVAFVVHGEVFVASVEYGATKRITSTVEQERSVAWAPDGKTLYYASERHRDGSDLPSWNIYKASLAREDDEQLHRATLVHEEAVLEDARESFQPVPSPDGKHLAFLRDRDEICDLDLGTGEIRTLVPSRENYSYADGDIDYSWSPDSRWLAVIYLPNHRWIEQVGVVEVATGTVRDVTFSGYYEAEPRWSPDGRALAFRSNRYGRRSHGSWGSDEDVLAIYLTQAAYDRATLSEEDFDRQRDKEDEEREKKEKEREEEGAEGETEDGGESPPPPPVAIDFTRVDRRLRRLTLHSAPISDFVISNDGEACLYTAEMDGRWDVWMARPREGETRRVVRLGDRGGPSIELSQDGETLFIRREDGRIATADVGGLLEDDERRGRDDEDENRDSGGRSARAEPVDFRARLEIDRLAERKHLFEHIWRQVSEKFYRPDLHGVDWPAMRANYERFLDQVDNGYEFAELVSEMLGELNASHTGCYFRPDPDEKDATASLGLLFGDGREGEVGMPVAEVLEGGPAAEADCPLRAGHVLRAIDGERLEPAVNPWRLLEGKADRRVRLSLQDDKGGAYECVVRPITLREESDLLYRRLIERRRAIVDQASHGRIGYVHVAGMNDQSFRETFRETLGRDADREALIVDTRYNGGGWLHDELVVFLSGRHYMDFVPRGKKPGDLGGEPLHRWDRPSCVLVSEGNYSDAHLFPEAYRMHGIGKIVGAPVAGTGTAVWWEHLMDPRFVFGIPQVGMMDAQGRYMENHTLVPDVLVLTDPEKIAAGTDEQLLAAVSVLLDELDR